MSGPTPARWYTTTASETDPCVVGGCGHLHPRPAGAIHCARSRGELPVVVDPSGRTILADDEALLDALRIERAAEAEAPADLPAPETAAAARAAVVADARERMDGGASRPDAVRAAAAVAGRSASAVRIWLKRADAAEAQGQAAVAALTDRPRSGRPPKVWGCEHAEDAWLLFRVLRERPENPTTAGCWRTVREIADLQKWTGVPAEKEFQRRWNKVALLERVLATQGRIAALEMGPHQVRTVAGLEPLAWVNGDGYEHHLFVRPPGGGDPIRPCTWAWQDVRTRRILAWRSGPTETAELLRLSFHDLVTRYGIPRHALMDNTRAASARSFGGDSLRWRSDGEEPPGLLKSLGVVPHRTKVDREDDGKGRGRGRSKPVERSFLDWGEEIDKHPFAAGAYVGRNALDKPSNYGERALGWDEFLAIVDDGVRRLNARPGRRTEAAAGRSFDETWDEEYAAIVPRRLPPERTAILLLAAESTQVKKNGTFTLSAGSAVGQPRNQYHHENLLRVAALQDRKKRRVVARFDPADLHAGAEVFDFAGRWLCHAECHFPVGFADTEGAQKFERLHRSRIREAKRARQTAESMAALLEQYGIERPAKPLPPNVVRMPRPAPETDADRQRKRELRERFNRGLQRTGSQ